MERYHAGRGMSSAHKKLHACFKLLRQVGFLILFCLFPTTLSSFFSCVVKIQICVQFNLISTRISFLYTHNSCMHATHVYVEIKFLPLSPSLSLSFSLIFISFSLISQDVRLHCKIVRCQINRLTQFMLSALKALMAAYRKCFSSKWWKFPHLN